MPPTEVGSAFPQLQELAKWVHESAKMQQGTSLCVDENRVGRTLPFLKALGYDKIQGYGIAIHRISGKADIVKKEGLRTLFFPLSVGSGIESIASGNVEVAGEILTPGTFMEIPRTTDLNACLDCLIIYLPERR